MAIQLSERYQLDTAYESLYEWCNTAEAWIFVSSTTAKTLEEAVAEYEGWQLAEELSGYQQ